MQHIDPVDALFARAKKAGVPMAAICAEAGVAQSTPSRWKSDRNTANLATLNSLNEALDRIVSARAAA